MLSEYFHDECEVEESEEEHVEFFEAGEDSAEASESSEEPLDLVAFPLKSAVEGPRMMRLHLGGTTGTMPRSKTSCRVSLPS
jgi:hypothetical protein